MPKISSFGVPDASENKSEIQIPIVVLKNTDKEIESKFRGFIPALTENDVFSDNVNSCLTKLSLIAEKTAKKMKKNKQPFPFFPSESSLIVDFPNLEVIKLITIKL